MANERPTTNKNPRSAQAQSRFDEAMQAIERGDYSAAFIALRTPEFTNDAEALNKLGELYEKGLGVASDFTKAERFYKQSASFGFARGQVNYGRMLLEHPDTRSEFAQARNMFEKSAEQGDSLGLYMQGFMAFEGMGGNQDNLEALICFVRAVKGGCDKAKFFLPLAMKRELELDDSVSLEDAFEASKQDNSEAFMHFMIMQAMGMGILNETNFPPLDD